MRKSKLLWQMQFLIYQLSAFTQSLATSLYVCLGKVKDLQLLLHVPWRHMEGWKVEVELYPVLTLALDVRWAVSFTA
jgi:hypothetical protein